MSKWVEEDWDKLRAGMGNLIAARDRAEPGRRDALMLGGQVVAFEGLLDLHERMKTRELTVTQFEAAVLEKVRAPLDAQLVAMQNMTKLLNEVTTKLEKLYAFRTATQRRLEALESGKVGPLS